MRGAWVVLRKHSTLCSTEMAGSSQISWLILTNATLLVLISDFLKLISFAVGSKIIDI